MAILRGTAAGREGPLKGVTVELKDERFQTVYSAVSGADGGFALEAPEGRYPFLTAVRDYGEKYLEYWAQNVPVRDGEALRVRIDALEVYGLHAFTVKGAANALLVYFRPMSLCRFQAGEGDIAPELKEENIEVEVDGQRSRVYVCDRVREYAGGAGFLTAYLIQVSVPGRAGDWRRVDLTVRDREGAFGCAALFR